MHLRLQVACNTSSCSCNYSNSNSSCCSGWHTHRPPPNCVAFSQTSKQVTLSLLLTVCLALTLAAISGFFLIIKWLRTGNNSYAPYAALTIHQRQPPTRRSVVAVMLLAIVVVAVAVGGVVV